MRSRQKTLLGQLRVLHKALWFGVLMAPTKERLIQKWQGLAGQ